MLMMAILEDALKCYFDYAGASTRRKSKIFDEAEQWFFSMDDEGIFSFENICAVFGIDPGYVRRGLVLFKNGSSHRAGRRKRFSSKAPTYLRGSNNLPSGELR
jgi:hypothetical protein